VKRTRNILARGNAPLLAAFGRGSVVLAFDYDGTLAPLTANRDRARMRATTSRLLQRLALLYPCVVISGRALADVSRRVRHVPLRCVFGNHGLEPVMNGTRPRPATRLWLRHLRERLAAEPGVVIEDKVHTLTVHYRAARNRPRALASIGEAAEGLAGVRVVHGALAVNFLPRGGANKGVAVRRAMDLVGCRTALYVGDDGTDEDAFASVDARRLLAIRVGASRASMARYHLPAQADIDALLSALIDLRPSTS
jgi:trehalose 6-phosphate phosphatase